MSLSQQQPQPQPQRELELQASEPVYSTANFRESYDPRALFQRQTTDWGDDATTYSGYAVCAGDASDCEESEYATICDGRGEAADTLGELGHSGMPSKTAAAAAAAHDGQLMRNSRSRSSSSAGHGDAGGQQRRGAASAAAGTREITEAYLAAVESGRNRESFVRVSDRWGLPLPDMILIMADFERQQSEEM